MLANAIRQPTTAHFLSQIGSDHVSAAAAFAFNAPHAFQGMVNFAFQSVGALRVWDLPHIAKTRKLLKYGIYYRDVYDAHTLLRA
jgi:hypothetical protein